MTISSTNSSILDPNDPLFKLNRMYGQFNGASMFQPPKKLVSMSQGSGSISSYYTKIKRKWDQPGSLYDFPTCECGTGQAPIKIQHQQLFQFLKGLNKAYAAVKKDILRKTPLPSVTEAFSLLIQEEKLRELQSSSSSSGAQQLLPLRSLCQKVSPHTNFAGNEHKREFELKSPEKVFTCYGCKCQGFGPRSVCNRSQHEFHNGCRSPTPTLSPKSLPGTLFKFSEKPRPSWRGRACDACGRDVLGFNYHCTAKKLDLHPCCVHLKSEVKMKGSSFALEKQVVEKCMACNSKIAPGGDKGIRGWSYVSRCRTYHFHVYCVSEIALTAAMSGDDLALVKGDLKKLAKSRSKKGGSSAFLSIVKILMNAVLSVLLGDPSTLIAAFVESFFLKN